MLPSRISTGGTTVIIMLAALSLYLVNAQRMVLMDPDEARCALIAQEMVKSGNWLFPISPLTDQPYFDKPILYFWLLASAFKVFGVNELAARLVSAIGAAFLVGTVDQLGRLLFGHRAGRLSSIMLGSSAMMVIAGRFVRMDIWFTLFITLAIFYWCRWHFAGASSQNLLYGYLSMAAALLTKGLLGVLLPGGAIGCFLLVRRGARWQIVRRSELLLGSLVILLTAGVWYGYMEWRFPGYLKDFFYRHHILRATTSTFGRSQTIALLPGVLLAGLLPWTAVFIAAVIRTLLVRHSRDSTLDPGQRLCLWWLGLGLVPLMLSRTQLPVYVLPAFPAAAILAGYHLELLLVSPFQSRELRCILLSTAVLMALGIATLSIINHFTFDVQPWRMLARRSFFLLSGLAVLVYLIRKGYILYAVGLIASLAMAGAVDTAWIEGPRLAELYSTAGLGERIRLETSDEEFLVMGPSPAFGVALYSGMPLPIRPADHMVDFLAFTDYPRTLLGVLTSRLLLERAQARLGDRLDVIMQHGENTLVRLWPPAPSRSQTQPARRKAVE